MKSACGFWSWRGVVQGLGLGVLVVVLAGCMQPAEEDRTAASAANSVEPIDADASPQTRALLRNLREIRHRGFLFGHQDTLAYGVEWMDEPGRSDIKDVTGDYPALYGWDLGHLERGDAANLDGVNFARMQDWIKDSYRRGGVVTVSWHMRHPVTDGSSWDTETGAADLVPGGKHHRKLKAALDRFAEFITGLDVTDESGDVLTVPVIFRPWHEHNGNWFWWGKGHTSEQEYIALWRFTVDYLRDEKQLHNLLFAFSPDRSRLDMNDFRRSYLYAYPGDDYVDILGLDNYWDLGHPSNETPPEQSRTLFGQSLAHLVKLAEDKRKLPAMTEGGQDTLPEPNFWTRTFLAGILANEQSRGIAYAQVWRNANRAKEGRDHFYAPFKGHPSVEDFVEFYRHPATLFESDLPDMYE